MILRLASAKCMFIVVTLGLTPPSKTYYYDDRTCFLGEDIVIESPVQTGTITWFVFYKPNFIRNCAKLARLT